MLTIRINLAAHSGPRRAIQTTPHTLISIRPSRPAPEVQNAARDSPSPDPDTSPSNGRAAEPDEGGARVRQGDPEGLEDLRCLGVARCVDGGAALEGEGAAVCLAGGGGVGDGDGKHRESQNDDVGEHGVVPCVCRGWLVSGGAQEIHSRQLILL